ncbi:unnamed protein product [Rhizophagus irregularis]|nr:unnamed protein product [Rhizophagus irregularis]
MIAHKEENDIEIKVYNGEYDSDIEAELEQVNVEHNFDNNQEERDEIIPNDENEGLTSQKYNALSPCVIIDNIHDEETKKKDILRSIVKVIFPFISTSTKITSSTLNNFKSDETPSLFTIQILFLDTSISNSKECDDILDCEKFR